MKKYIISQKIEININIHRSIEDSIFNRNELKINACFINNRTFEVASTLTHIKNTLK